MFSNIFSIKALFFIDPLLYLEAISISYSALRLCKTGMDLLLGFSGFCFFLFIIIYGLKMIWDSGETYCERLYYLSGGDFSSPERTVSLNEVT